MQATTHLNFGQSVRTWFTSDNHFGHKNIARFTDRPFPHGEVGLDAMDEAMIAEWNSKVAPDDHVIIVGDFSFYGHGKTEQIVKRLNGRLHLIYGNHDPQTSSRVAKTDRNIAAYKAMGFETVTDLMTWEFNGERFLICHYPYEGDSREEDDRYPDRRPPNTGMKLIHGHVHEKWRKHGNQVNVGMDAWGGEVVPAETIVAMFDHPDHYVPKIPWV